MQKAVKDTLLQMNTLGRKRKPFFFLVNFQRTQCKVYDPSSLEKENIWINFPEFYNRRKQLQTPGTFSFLKSPIPFSAYQKGFDKVKQAIIRGDSFLLNLTCPTPIDTSLSFEEIFDRSKAKYKVKYKDEFVFFSPEPFISIKGNIIQSFPMKGTMDAGVPDAEEKLLNNPKEIAEHNTIVDLIRNDLNIVSQKVKVEKFRYLEKVQTHTGELLQSSSIISGELSNGWQENIGDLLFKLLPAGSISGAPKKRTLEIIQEAEGYDRGWFTGICGYFDGQNLDSAVMIRFIENQNGKLIFKSGGGITSFSIALDEYKEMVEKVYVPIKVGNPKLIETIKVEGRVLQNIDYHNARLNKSRKELFGISNLIDLEKEIIIPAQFSNGIYKCRITYAEKIDKVEFEKYEPPKIRSLKPVECNDIEYNYKFADRSKINELFANRGNCDDILIIKNGLVTDTSFANIVFWEGEKWITPLKPLLAGSARARLLDSNKIFEVEIKADDLWKFKKARIINAMNNLSIGEDILDIKA